MEKLQIRQAAVFAILMQGGGGIVTKHPSYIAEKFQSAMTSTEPEHLLDSPNMSTFRAWKEEWKIDDETT